MKVTEFVFSGTFIADSFEALERAGYLEEWDRLARTMPTHMPFQTVEWNRTWWSTFQRRGALLRDELYIVCVVRDGRLIGVIPLFMTAIGFSALPIFRYLRLLGADGNLTEWRSVICKPEDREEVQAQWRLEMEKYRFGLCFFQIRGFTASEVHAARLEDLGLVEFQLPSVAFVLPLTHSWETFKSRLKRNIKESLRHCYNSLKRANYSPSFSVIDEPELLRLKLKQFYHWHALRAQDTETVLHPDYFKNAKHRLFMESLSNALCARGQMKLFELRLNDTPVAYRLGFVHGDTVYLHFSAFDPKYAKFSVMTTLVAEIIKWAINHQFGYVNLSFGRDVSKTRWGPSEMKFFDARIATKGLWLLHTYHRILDTIKLVQRLSDRISKGIATRATGRGGMRRFLGDFSR